MKLLLSFVLTITLSPIWPLGPNPIAGDPYIIINKQTNELAFINKGDIQQVYPVATGVFSNLTPEGSFTVLVKAADPYYRRKNIKGGSPDNPLGTRWIGFDAEGTDGRIYGIHGTNNELSIGKYVSNGCIRMRNKNVEELYNRIPLGTKVFIHSSEKSFQEIGKENGALK